MTDNRGNVWLPIVATPPKDLAREFFNELASHPNQEHPSLIWDSCLVIAAHARAQQVAITFDHCFVGSCANRIIRIYCSLPAEYPENGNSVESLVGGVEDHSVALRALLRSEKHANHLLGRTPFFKEQNRVGIAFLHEPKGKYQYYYVILISK